MLPIRITDDRGNRVDLYSPERASLFAGASSRDSAGLYVIREAVGGRQRFGIGWYIGAAVSGLIGLFFLYIAFTLFMRRNYGAATFIVLLIAYAIFEMVWKRWFRRWRYREEIARALRARGRCASCGYSLAGIDADGSGMLTCPECGASWRSDGRRADEGDAPRWERPRPWLTKFVRDDRGWRGRLRYGLRPSLIGIRPRRKRTVFRACGRPAVALYALVWVLLPSSIVVFFLGMFYGDYGVGARLAIILSAVGVGIGSLLAQGLGWKILAERRAERVRRALLESGFCPLCDERLPTESAEDGCRVCEECGSAWRVSDSEDLK